MMKGGAISCGKSWRALPASYFLGRRRIARQASVRCFTMRGGDYVYLITLYQRTFTRIDAMPRRFLTTRARAPPLADALRPVSILFLEARHAGAALPQRNAAHQRTPRCLGCAKEVFTRQVPRPMPPCRR